MFFVLIRNEKKRFWGAIFMDARAIALNQVTREYIEFDAEIYFRNKIEGTSINKYLWTIIFYHSPKNMSSGESTVVYVDPVSGIIEAIEETGWATAY